MFANEDKPTSYPGLRADERAPSGVAPATALRVVRLAVPVLYAAAVALCVIGLAVGFRLTPADVGRGELSRIDYMHVAATWAALLLYAAIVFFAFVQLLAGPRIASMMVEAIAPTAALFALLALWTGSLWSKAAAAVWWDWDAHSLVDLTLLFFAVGCVVLRDALGEGRTAEVAVTVIALAGGATTVVAISAIALVPQVGSYPQADAIGPGIAAVGALASVTAGFLAYGGATSLSRLRCVILERERGSAWLENWSER